MSKPEKKEKKHEEIRVTQLDFWEPNIETSAYLRWVLEGYNLEIMGISDFELENVSRDDLEKLGLFILKIVKAIDNGFIYKLQEKK